MKKYLAILGLLAFISAPAFAMCPCSTCPTCLPRVQEVAIPVESCAPICPCSPCATGAACPVVISHPCCNTCSPCLTGAACPCNTCNTCNIFSKGVAYPSFHNNFY